ncbi:MAG TPA: 6,7-dimethyl-8-ribityllumazine synthase [Verrucomicrobiae bacterium]|nr:6,7-dimethyl-8-ribityllumazine synthase [Verrucomicrobiae bacterium]
MLKKVSASSVVQGHGRFAIVASSYNARFVDSMLRAARLELARAGIEEIEVVRVPGAYEIPVVAGQLARRRTKKLAAIICFGVILRGATTHAQHIGDAVSLTLAQIAAETGVPVIHGVYLFENEKQAVARCLDPRHNRGIEGARTALVMSEVMRGLL